MFTAVQSGGGAYQVQDLPVYAPQCKENAWLIENMPKAFRRVTNVEKAYFYHVYLSRDAGIEHTAPVLWTR